MIITQGAAFFYLPSFQEEPLHSWPSRGFQVVCSAILILRDFQWKTKQTGENHGKDSFFLHNKCIVLFPLFQAFEFPVILDSFFHPLSFPTFSLSLSFSSPRRIAHGRREEGKGDSSVTLWKLSVK